MAPKAKTSKSERAPVEALLDARPAPALVTWMVCAYLLLMPVSDIALRWSSAQVAGSELTGDRSRFAVINALTLTGFPYTIGLDTFTTTGKAIILLLMLAGSLFSLVVGGLAVVRILRLPYTDRQVLTAAGFFAAVFTLGGAAPLIASGDHPFHAVFLSASAFGNGGLAFGKLPGIGAWETHLVLLPLAFAGSLGLPVLMELADRLRTRRPLSLHSRVVAGFSCGLYLIGFAIFFAMLLGASESRTALAKSSSVTTMNSHTLGFPFHHASDFPRAMQWMLVLVMMIGGSPAGTAGGIKTTTLATLYRGIRGGLGGVAPGRSFAIAAVWVACYLLMTGLFFGLLLIYVPQHAADRLLFETVSAVSNVGLSHETISVVSPGLDVLTVAMVFGRLAPLAILWWMAQTTRDAELAVG